MSVAWDIICALLRRQRRLTYRDGSVADISRWDCVVNGFCAALLVALGFVAASETSLEAWWFLRK